MARFQDAGAYHAPEKSVRLLPFRFDRAGSDGYLVSNMVGDFVRLIADEFDRLIDERVSPGDGLYEKAYAANLITREGQTAQLQMLAARLRSRMAFLREPSGLHMFVVTLRCEHSCPYCQVSRQSTDRTRFDMSEDTAERALRIALESPSPRIKIEFQGGEPLLNFPLIAKIVENAKFSAPKTGKKVEFVIASNLALLTDDILAFCKRNDVLLSTSLDGPADLHNRNRPRPGGNSYELAVKGIKAAQSVLGADRVGALMTTTEASLDRVEEIIDEYIALGLDGIFLRPLSPYGFAVKTKQIKKYDAKRWLDFYVRGLRYILDINRRGHELFRVLYDPVASPHADRRAHWVCRPAKPRRDRAGSTGLQLRRQGLRLRRRTHAGRDGRQHIRAWPRRARRLSLAHPVGQTGRTLSGHRSRQCAPECLNCVFESHCGADPVYHHATQSDPVGLKPLSGFCARQKGVMGTILDLLDHSPEDAAVLRRWGGM